MEWMRCHAHPAESCRAANGVPGCGGAHPLLRLWPAEALLSADEALAAAALSAAADRYQRPTAVIPGALVAFAGAGGLATCRSGATREAGGRSLRGGLLILASRAEATGGGRRRRRYPQPSTPSPLYAAPGYPRRVEAERELARALVPVLHRHKAARGGPKVRPHSGALSTIFKERADAHRSKRTSSKPQQAHR